MLRLFRFLLGFVLLLGLLLGGAFIYLRLSLPKLKGELVVAGVQADVTILRDRNAVPHIRAQTQEDALFALGFVHAQDRLWQMEFQRRVASGRLSEVLGSATLNTDKFIRTLGIYDVSERSKQYLSPRTLGKLQAYVDGINSYLETRRGPLPPEFLLLRFEPAPFTITDVIAWGKMMAWDLGGNWDDELLRARQSQILSTAQLQDFWPPYPGDAPIALSDTQQTTLNQLYAHLPLELLWSVSPKPLPPGAGSNNWVVSGERSVSGLPLLANDPHLGLQSPSLWYFARLDAPGLQVMGASLPGTPAILLGRTDTLAWGFTNTNPDVQDLFIERVNPDNPAEYETPDGFEAFTVREEVIKVKGEEDVRLLVRESRHGPVISDVNAAAQGVAEASAEMADGAADSTYVIAFAWTTLREDDVTVQASLNMNTARNVDEFVTALRDFQSPQQNIVYADTTGNIGFYAPARVPVRANGDGSMPVPGWSGEYDWQGFIPFRDLPQAFNPESGQIVTANHKITPDDYPYFLTRDWSEPYRAERIEALLSRMTQHSVASFAQIQADQHSLMAEAFLPFLLSARPETEAGRQAQAQLLAWDGTMNANDAAPLLFAAWYRELSPLIYEDELGELFQDSFGFRPLFMHSVLTGESRHDWCDDVRTTLKEDCQSRIDLAFTRASAYLSERYGADTSAWRWGDAHIANFDHDVLGQTPLKALTNVRLPNGGDAFTVNAARFDMRAAAPFEQTTGPGFRAVYDLSNLDNSVFMHAPGQSGNPLSRRYQNYAQSWAEVTYLPMSMNDAAITQKAIGTLTLQPAD